MSAFELLVVWLHILAAAIWIGGMIFLALVLLPLTRRPEFRAAAPSLIRWTGIRFRGLGWACLILLVATGILNLAIRGFTWEHFKNGAIWQSPFGQVLAIKLFLLALILVLSLAHDFYIGPRATAAWHSDPGSAQTRRLRAQAGWIGRVNLLLALILVGLGVILVRGLL